MQKQLSFWTTTLEPWILTHGLRIILIIIGFYLINKVIHKFIEKTVRLLVLPDLNSNDESEKKRENTLISIFSATFFIALLSISSLMVLQEIGMEIGPLLAGAGIIGLAFGFGGQYLIRDIITGLFIIIENQYRIGDVVKFDSLGGTVERITLRMTTLRDLDGVVHHIPHGEVKQVSNWSKQFARINLNIGVAYNTNLDHAIAIINTTGNQMFEDPFWKLALITPPQFLRVNDLGDSAISLKVLGETIPNRQWEVTGEFRKRIKEAFDKEGIEIPFPQVVMHHKSTKPD
ncbi:mechanosensitive ion channel family protein [Flavobacterium cellulosilyticum]|uniref:Mechanosensitive ion channel family protein n=1 Tax=Flavobacterium cellulosilyticum TaxID=2541731 RepID=A0A4R5CBW2_9FLAO|nr:mechanosensitive ion channel family protein [Flavobacterium cellulosilyticum]TDD97451.1 mechanosensitive ion channel family protein [Flavobacterium cellulosilyticum]